MRVGIDAVTPGASLQAAVSGMRHYICALVSSMSALDRSVEYVVFERAQAHLHELEGLPNVSFVSCLGLPSHRLARVAYQNSALPLVLRRHHLDITLGTCNVVPVGCPEPFVVVLQSLQYFVHQSMFGRLRTGYLRSFVRSSLRRANSVVALSDAAKTEAIRLTRVDPKKVFTVHHGISPHVRAWEAGPPTQERPRVPYILSISTLFRYKNIERVIRAYAELKWRYGLPHRLRVVGVSAEVKIETLKAIAKDLRVDDSVDFLGGVSHLVIPEQYVGADVFIYASLHETFGLPPLEAMALGCPVVVSRASSLPEVVGDAAELVDPYDPSDIARGIAYVVGDAARRAQLVQRGYERAAEFTWERAAERMLDVLRSTRSAYASRQK
jgi:glycosyltransferase involved in cell wall biosynthesis